MRWIARAMDSRCFCPPETFVLPWAIREDSPLSIFLQIHWPVPWILLLRLSRFRMPPAHYRHRIYCFSHCRKTTPLSAIHNPACYEAMAASICICVTTFAYFVIFLNLEHNSFLYVGSLLSDT